MSETDVTMEDLLMENKEVVKSLPNAGEGNLEKKTNAKATSRKPSHPLKLYLHNHRQFTWIAIKCLNQDIKALAKLPWTLAIDVKLRKVLAYRKLDNELESEQAVLHRSPHLLKSDKHFKAIRVLVESREAEIAALAVNGEKDAELDGERKERLEKYLSERAAKKSAVRKAQRARQSARKAEAKALKEMTKKAEKLTVAEKSETVVSGADGEEKQVERTPLKRKRVDGNEDVMDDEGEMKKRPTKKILPVRLHAKHA